METVMKLSSSVGINSPGVFRMSITPKIILPKIIAAVTLPFLIKNFTLFSYHRIKRSKSELNACRNFRKTILTLTVNREDFFLRDAGVLRSEEHTSELQSRPHLV